MSWKCKCCGQFKPKNERYLWNYCSEKCYEQYFHKKCRCCGKEFIAEKQTQRFCKECDKNVRQRKEYNEQLIWIKCKRCGEYFQAKSHQYVCEKCRIKSKESFVHHFNVTFQRPIFCKKCNNFLGYEEANISWRTNKIHFVKSCDNCKCKQKKFKKFILNNKFISKEEKKITKLFDKFYSSMKYKKISRTLVRKSHTQHFSEEERQRRSTKMKLDNPMKNKEIAKKVSESLLIGYSCGRIKKRYGKENPIYKGNRGLNLDVRTRLSPIWIQPILKRDNFSCVMCGKTHVTLHVHHIRPLRQIIDKILKHFSVKVCDLEPFSEEYEKIIEAILHEHKLSDGISLCKECHEKIDYKYRLKGKKKNKLAST